MNKQKKNTFHYGFVIVACCCLIMGVNIGLTFSCAGIFYTPICESLDVTKGEFGIYMSVMYVTSILTLTLAGQLVERLSARWLFSGCSALMGLTFGAMAFFNSLWEFYVAGGVLGITTAFLLYLSFPTLVNRWFRSKVGLMIGICSAASGIGGILFNPVAGGLIENIGWRWTYGVFAVVLLLVVTPLLALLLRDRPSDKGLLPYGDDGSAAAKKADKAADGIEYGKAVRMPAFYAVMVFSFVIMAVSKLNLFIPGYVRDSSFSIEQASIAAAVVMAGVTIGKLVLGWINDRNCAMGVATAMLCGIIGLVLVVFGSDNIWLIYAGSFLFGWEYSGVTVQTTMLTRSVFGNRSYVRIYSMVSIALAAGGALASGGWGLLSDRAGFSTIFICGAAALAVGLVLGEMSLLSARSKSKAGTLV